MQAPCSQAPPPPHAPTLQVEELYALDQDLLEELKCVRMVVHAMVSACDDLACS